MGKYNYQYTVERGCCYVDISATYTGDEDIGRNDIGSIQESVCWSTWGASLSPFLGFAVGLGVVAGLLALGVDIDSGVSVFVMMLGGPALLLLCCCSFRERQIAKAANTKLYEVVKVNVDNRLAKKTPNVIYVIAKPSHEMVGPPPARAAITYPAVQQPGQQMTMNKMQSFSEEGDGMQAPGNAGELELEVGRTAGASVYT